MPPQRDMVAGKYHFYRAAIGRIAHGHHIGVVERKPLAILKDKTQYAQLPRGIVNLNMLCFQFLCFFKGSNHSLYCGGSVWPLHAAPLPQNPFAAYALLSALAHFGGRPICWHGQAILPCCR